MTNDKGASKPVAPHQPTEAMLNAARDWSVKRYGQGIGSDAATGCWQAMLAASPAVPAQSGEPVDEIRAYVVTYRATGAKELRWVHDVAGFDPTHYQLIPLTRLASPQPVAQARRALNLGPAMTPFGMLVRALRIVAGTTLYDMAKHLSCTSAMLSAVEFGRQPVTDAMVADASAYFSGRGIPDTLHALKAAAQPTSGANRE